MGAATAVRTKKHTVGMLTFTTDRRGMPQVLANGKPLHLSGMQSRILWHLAQTPDQWISKCVLYANEYGGRKNKANPKIIDVIATNIRRELELTLGDAIPDDRHLLVGDYQGNLALFSTPQPKADPRMKRKQTGVMALMNYMRNS